jgi:hypothetical protein
MPHRANARAARANDSNALSVVRAQRTRAELSPGLRVVAQGESCESVPMQAQLGSVPKNSLLSRAKWVLFVALLVLLASCATFPRLGHLTSDAAQKRVMRRVEAQRGLRFQEPVLADVQDADAFVAKLIEAARAPDEVLSALYWRWGFAKRQLSYADTYQALLSSGASAIYEAEHGRLTYFPNPILDAGTLLISPQSLLLGRDLSGSETVLHHELIHALQDQRYDYTRFLKAAKHNQDLGSSWHVLLESEGNLAMYADYLGLSMDNAGLSLALDFALGAALPSISSMVYDPRVSRSFQDSLNANYIWALDFIRTAGAEAGDVRHGLNGVWADARLASTEQLRWPEKYFRDEPDLPELVSAPTGLSQSGFARLTEDTSGCRDIWALLHPFDKAIDGWLEQWTGDRIALFGDENEDVFVWRLRFDTPEAAQGFRKAFVAQRRAEPYAGARIDELPLASLGGESLKFEVELAPNEAPQGVRYAGSTALDLFVVDQGRDVFIVEADRGVVSVDDVGRWASEVWAVLSPFPDHFPRPSEPLTLEVETKGPFDTWFLPTRTWDLRAGVIGPLGFASTNSLALRPPAGELADPLLPVLPALRLQWTWRERLAIEGPLYLRWAPVLQERFMLTIGGGLSTFNVVRGPSFGTSVTVATAPLPQVAFSGRVATSIDLQMNMALLAGVMMNVHVFDRIEIAPGLALERSMSLAEGQNEASAKSPTRVLVGSAFQQGGGPAPVVRLRLFGGFGIYVSTLWEIDSEDLAVTGAAHEGGLFLRF